MPGDPTDGGLSDIGVGGGGSGGPGDPLFIPPVTGTEQIGAVLRGILKAIELPRALSRLAELQKRSSDAEANHIAQQGISTATAAYNDLRGIINGLYAVASFANTAGSSSTGAIGAVHTGNFARTFPVVGNVYTITVPAVWVTAGTIVFCWPFLDVATLMASYPGTTYDFRANHVSNNPGVSFDVKIFDNAAPVGASYTFLWVAFS